jgi:predicted metal-dependent peptidase
LDYIDGHPDYDGLIVFTDGYAAVPHRPANRHTRVLWLFKDESTFQQMRDSLRPIGRAAYLKPSRHGRS